MLPRAPRSPSRGWRGRHRGSNASPAGHRQPPALPAASEVGRGASLGELPQLRCGDLGRWRKTAKPLPALTTFQHTRTMRGLTEQGQRYGKAHAAGNRQHRSLPGTRLPNASTQQSPFPGTARLPHGHPTKDTQLFAPKRLLPCRGGSEHPARSPVRRAAAATEDAPSALGHGRVLARSVSRDGEAADLETRSSERLRGANNFWGAQRCCGHGCSPGGDRQRRGKSALGSAGRAGPAGQALRPGGRGARREIKRFSPSLWPKANPTFKGLF